MKHHRSDEPAAPTVHVPTVIGYIGLAAFAALMAFSLDTPTAQYGAFFGFVIGIITGASWRSTL